MIINNLGKATVPFQPSHKPRIAVSPNLSFLAGMLSLQRTHDQAPECFTDQPSNNQPQKRQKLMGTGNRSSPRNPRVPTIPSTATSTPKRSENDQNAANSAADQVDADIHKIAAAGLILQVLSTDPAGWWGCGKHHQELVQWMKSPEDYERRAASTPAAPSPGNTGGEATMLVKPRFRQIEFLDKLWQEVSCSDGLNVAVSLRHGLETPFLECGERGSESLSVEWTSFMKRGSNCIIEFISDVL